MSEKMILVTGGAGYIGAHACKTLAMEGYTPVVFDNLIHGHEQFVQWGPFEKGDLSDLDAITDVIRKYRPSAVMHFAAYAYVGESVSNPEKYYRNNVGGSLNLLEAMVRNDVKRIVFSSTCATYGIPQQNPIPEEHPQQPINPYGASKLMVERMLKDFDTAHDIRSVALRYFNAAGADPDARIGEDHDPEPHLIPIALDVALGRRDQIEIYGETYDTPDGTCIRDYIHVSDLAEAHRLACEFLRDRDESEQFNLGNGSGHSVRAVIAAVERVTGRKIPAMIAPRRPGDPARLVGDATKAKRLLRWNPKYPQLETIIEHAWNWHRKRFG